jgi:hypothetical protein
MSIAKTWEEMVSQALQTSSPESPCLANKLAATACGPRTTGRDAEQRKVPAVYAGSSATYVRCYGDAWTDAGWEMTAVDTVAPGQDLWERVRTAPGVESLWVEHKRPNRRTLWIIGNGWSWDDRQKLYGLYRGWLWSHPRLYAGLNLVDRQDCPIEGLFTHGPDMIEYK